MLLDLHRLLNFGAFLQVAFVLLHIMYKYKAYS